ncbi:hypothetical protein ACJRO7_034247 [Eucalyptus globulus]|uniref:Uncharacterized protein n=1 Tax=Eucalyptus globulus TaxID=34317 RepID=A0ABD3J337_EUCGL
MGNTRRMVIRADSCVVQISCELEERVEKLHNGDELCSNSKTKTKISCLVAATRKRNRSFMCLSSIWNLPPGKHVIVKLGKKCSLLERVGTIVYNLKQITKDMRNAMIRIVEVVGLCSYEIPFILSLIIFVLAMEKWILHSSNSKWRYWKTDLKAAHYDSSQFSSLVLFYFILLQKLSDANKANRAKQKIQHTLGNKNFARITAIPIRFSFGGRRLKKRSEKVQQNSDNRERGEKKVKSKKAEVRGRLLQTLGGPNPKKLVATMPKWFGASKSSCLLTENLRSKKEKDEDIHKLKKSSCLPSENLRSENEKDEEIPKLKGMLKATKEQLQKTKWICTIVIGSKRCLLTELSACGRLKVVSRDLEEVNISRAMRCD